MIGISRMPAWLLVLAMAGTTSSAWGQAASGQGYPNRPIHLLMPFPAGGTPDALARTLATQVGSQLGQNIVVDNRTGANGVIAYEMAAKSAPDGYTLVQATPSFALNTFIFRKLPYSIKDFTPITNIAQGFGYLLLVHPSVPATSIKELITLAKNKDKPLAYGTPGVGNTLHLATELFNSRAETNMLHVPYKGVAPALTALLGGEIQVMLVQPPAGVAQVKAGKLRALGFTGAKRWDGMPNVPTITESALPGFVAHFTWNAWYAPAKTPRDIVLRLQGEVHKALQVPKVRDFFVDGGWEPLASSPEALRAYVDAELKRYAQAVQLAKIQPE